MADFKYNDLSSEDFREYVASNGDIYRIEKPVGHYISESGTHYVKDSTGLVHAIQRSAFMVVRWSDPTRGILYVNPSNPEGPTLVPAEAA